MRRTTQWAVFTSMNRQIPAWRSRYEPAEPKPAAGEVAESAAAPLPGDSGMPSVAPPRRDGVEFM